MKNKMQNKKKWNETRPRQTIHSQTPQIDELTMTTVCDHREMALQKYNFKFRKKKKRIFLNADTNRHIAQDVSSLVEREKKKMKRDVKALNRD